MPMTLAAKAQTHISFDYFIPLFSMYIIYLFTLLDT